jgi:hypothetical protein
MSKYFVCSKNGTPVDIRQINVELSDGTYDQVNAFATFPDLVAYLAGRPVTVEAPAPTPAPAAVAPAAVAPPVNAPNVKEVALTLLREYRGIGNDVLTKVKANPLFAQAKAEWKKVFGDQFKTFFVKLQGELRS